MEIWDELNQLALLVQRRKDFNYQPHHLFLTRGIPANGTEEGYRVLARLVRAGYFSTVLTSKTDTALEVAFREHGPPQYDVFVVGHTSDEQVSAVLEGQEDDGIHIVKLYSHEPQIHQASLASRFSPEIQSSLRYYFSKSTIIVGYMDQEEESIAALQFDKERTMYYILPHAPSPNDIMVKYLDQQGNRLENFLITGNNGEFNTFFCTLEKNINNRIGQKQESSSVYRYVIDESFASLVQKKDTKHFSVEKVIKIFYICSSAREDIKWQKRIEQHIKSLRNLGKIDQWHVGKLRLGEERPVAIRKYLEEAQVILLLGSVDLDSSEEDYQVTKAMERHKAKTATVIPIILRPFDWRGGIFDIDTVLPEGGRPITSWRNRDEALFNVAQGVRKVIQDLIKR